MNLKLKIRVQNCRNIEKACDAIFENVIENIMNINVVMILYVIGIIICDLIYHLKELYVIYASEIIVRSIVYIVCKTVITVEFPNAKYRRKQIKVHLNLPVEKMGHLYHRHMGHGFRLLLPPFLYYPPLFSKFSYKSFLFQNFHNRSFFLHLTISVDVIHHE